MAMLHLLDESLEEFLRATVPLPKREIDVVFAAPDKDWAARVSRPTINLYLWDVRRNLSERDLGVQTVPGVDGRTLRRPPLPRVDCRYLVTAWTSDIRDEHSLLGDTLAAFLRYPELETDYLQGVYQTVRPVPTVEVGAGDGRDNSDFWSALGGQLKPGLDITVTATVDSALLVPAGPPVERYMISATPGDAERNGRSFVGGRTDEPPGTVVSTPHGAVEVGTDGTFLVPAEAGDQLSVDGEPKHRIGDAGSADLRESREEQR
jgi:hypothetical protein